MGGVLWGIAARFWGAHPLVVLLLLDLLHLVQQLAGAQLQLRQFVLRCDLGVIVGVFAHLDVQMDPLRANAAVSTSGCCVSPPRPPHVTSLPPANRAMRVELECRQIWCSPGVCDVKVKRPSEPYCLDSTT